MYFVYSLISEDQNHWYIGVTDNIERRLIEHNQGQSVHTNKFKPWKLTAYIAFETIEKAQAFEKYLKSHSGRAFAKKHF